MMKFFTSNKILALVAISAMFTAIGTFDILSGKAADAVSITTTSLPNGTAGVDYAAAVEATVVSGDYTWSFTGVLPPGLTFAGQAGTMFRNRAIISGRPSVAGIYRITATVTAGGRSVSRQLGLNILSTTTYRCIQQPGFDRLRSDFAAYFNTARQGDVKNPWAGGSLTMGLNGRAQYLDASSVLHVFTKDSDVNDLFFTYPGIRESWLTEYGADCAGVPATPTPTVTPTPTYTGKITLLSPNGGEALVKGTPYTIRWTGGYPTKTTMESISLQLYQDGAVMGLIASGIDPGVKSYSWDPAKVKSSSGQPFNVDVPAGNYTIGVLDYNVPTVNYEFDLSDARFTVTGSGGGCGSSVQGANGLTYGSVLAADGKCWLDRNLGATRVATDPNDHAAFGYYYQWGRRTDGHQSSNSSITFTPSYDDTPTHGNFIATTAIPSEVPYDWRKPQNDDLWQGVNGVNNPCPAGWRVPTISEWTAVAAAEGITDYATAFSSKLKLPSASMRRYTGPLAGDPNFGMYWSSSVRVRSADLRQSYSYVFDHTGVGEFSYYRTYGHSVRCVRDAAVTVTPTPTPSSSPTPAPTPSPTIGPGALSIVTEILPDGKVGNPYSAYISAVNGGSEPYSWSVVGSLPDGLVIGNSTCSTMPCQGPGRLTGTPIAAGSSYVTIKVVAGDRVATKQFYLAISSITGVTPTPAPTPTPGLTPTPTPSAPPASCAANPGSWYLDRYPDVKNSAFGQMVNGGLTHYCRYGKSEGRENCFTADACEVACNNPDTLSILEPGALYNGQVNVKYGVNITASPVCGGYSWSATGLPPGLSLTGCNAWICRNTGKLTGTPTAAGNYNVTVTAVASGKSVSKTYGLTVESCECTPKGKEDVRTATCAGHKLGTYTTTYVCDGCHWAQDALKTVDACRNECEPGYHIWYGPGFTACRAD